MEREKLEKYKDASGSALLNAFRNGELSRDEFKLIQLFKSGSWESVDEFLNSVDKSRSRKKLTNQVQIQGVEINSIHDLLHHQLTPSEFSIYVCLYRLSRRVNRSTCSVGYNTLKKRTGFCVNTIKKYLRSLKNKGLVQVVRSYDGLTPKTYLVNLPNSMSNVDGLSKNDRVSNSDGLLKNNRLSNSNVSIKDESIDN